MSDKSCDQCLERAVRASTGEEMRTMLEGMFVHGIPGAVSRRWFEAQIYRIRIAYSESYKAWHV